MPSITSVTRTESPRREGMLRISCEVTLRGQPMEPVWVDYPPALDPFVDASGNPWAILLLPTAVVSGESLDVALPVDEGLVENLHALQRTWASWYDWASTVAINAERSEALTPSSEHSSQRGAGLFFTGGVDSLFSLIRFGTSGAKARAEEPLGLITIHGFDIPLANEPDFEKVVSLCREMGQAAGSSCVPVATNLRAIEGFGRGWGPLSHGAGLTGIGHLFSGMFSRLIIGSSVDHDHLRPWGSHPSSDPLFGSRDVEVVHDGAEFTRVEKTRAIVERPDLLAKLRVCYSSRGANNCSNCGKCLRTMVTIDLYGGREAAASFDWSKYSVDRVSDVYLDAELVEILFLEIREAATGEGRSDIVAAMDRAIARSARRRRWREPLHGALKDLASLPAVRPLVRRIAGNFRAYR